MTRVKNSFENINTKTAVIIRMPRLEELFKEYLKMDSCLAEGDDSEL